MWKFKTMVKCLGFFMLSCLVLPNVAYAYLDPGTGSYVLQMIIAFVLGGLVAIKHFWKRIISIFKRK
jgi:hypothetical protein